MSSSKVTFEEFLPDVNPDFSEIVEVPQRVVRWSVGRAGGRLRAVLRLSKRWHRVRRGNILCMGESS